MGRITTDNIKYFRTVNEFNSAYTGEEYIEPWVSYCTESAITKFNKSMREKPLTFKIISAGTINWATNNTSYTRTIEYKKNNGEWTEITSNTGETAPTISVNNGDTVQFRGNNLDYADVNNHYNLFNSSTAKFEAEGNIMSLIDGVGYLTATTLSHSYTFFRLFNMCTGLICAENLILPATTLVPNCYQYMFLDCTSLVTPPELPSTTLADWCYYSMFQGFKSLTTEPSLPATTLANYCYQYMFKGCSSLMSTSELQATTLANYCYGYMFNGCSHLNYIKAMFTTTASPTYTNYWVGGVAATGTFVKNSAAEWDVTGTNGIPSGWTVQTASE